MTTPTLEQIIEGYAFNEWEHGGVGQPDDHRAAALLALVAHDAEVAATALEEAADETRSLIHAAELRNRAAAIRSTVNDNA